MARTPDPIKDWIASETVAAAKFFERRGIPVPNVHDVAFHGITATESQIRVKLETGGMRCFKIVVSEVY